MLRQRSSVVERDDSGRAERAQPVRTMPMDAYLLADRLVVHVDLLDADPQTTSVTLDRGVLSVRAAHTSGGGADASYARPLTLARGLGRHRLRARVHDGIVTVMLDLGHGQNRSRPAARR